MHLLIVCLFLSICLTNDHLIGECNTCLFTQKDYSGACPGNNTIYCSAAKVNCQFVNASCILQACLNGPLILGIANDPHLFSVIFTTSSMISGFLPANGTPSVFTSNGINPFTTPAGVFAGELLVAILNFEFFRVNSIRFSSNCSFVQPIFYNMTVETLIYISNKVIAGDTSNFMSELTPESLTQALSVYNNARQNETLGQCFICNMIIEEPSSEPSSSPPSDNSGDNGNISILIIVIVLIFIIILIIVVVVVVLVYVMKSRASPPKLPSRFR